MKEARKDCNRHLRIENFMNNCYGQLCVTKLENLEEMLNLES